MTVNGIVNYCMMSWLCIVMSGIKYVAVRVQFQITRFSLTIIILLFGLYGINVFYSIVYIFNFSKYIMFFWRVNFSVGNIIF